MFRVTRSVAKVAAGSSQKEMPGVKMAGLTITKFDGSHTYHQKKNMWILMQEAAPLLAMPTMYVILSMVKYVLHAAVPLFVDTWYVTAAMCAGAGRIVAKGNTNRVVKDLQGKNVVITGATRGIGLHTAMQLAQMGANLHIVGRQGVHVGDAMKQIRAAAKGGAMQEVKFSAVDLSDLDAVQDFTLKLRKEDQAIDLLVQNAAALKFENRKVTPVGDDEMLVVNLLSPYLMTEGLLPLVQKSSAGRIVNVGSSAHAGVSREVLQKYLNEEHHAEGHKHNALEHYGFTKLGLIYYTQALGARSYLPTAAEGESAASVSTPTYMACCANPGGVVTDIYRDIKYATTIFHYLYYPFLLVMRTPFEGSQTIVNCCVRDDIVNGGCYMDCQHMPDSLSPVACDVDGRSTMMEWVQRKLIPQTEASAATSDRQQQQQR
jgi:NAD(P)-dependent dehydrogenase (short-subunit alcohol dehydrogenase family)